MNGRTPKLELLDDALLRRVLDEAFQLLEQPGIRVQTAAAVDLLAGAGANVAGGVIRLPRALVEPALASAPKEFHLYDRGGQPAVHYGGDRVQFDPGSSCLNVLDPDTMRPRPAQAADLVRLIKVAEMLPQYAAQSTAMVCGDVPSEIGDLYRLFLVLWYSDKPVVTGAFTAAGLRPMIDLLRAERGDEQLRARPRAIFDVCPTPPLNWSEFACENLLELARAGVPAQIVSMPLAGVAAPVTLAGSVVQHAAECLSGITIHQLASPGAPIVWGGAPAVVDMRTGTTPMGAIETAMIDMACAQVGKRLGLPTHAYLVASDSKLVDAQAGVESGISAVLGALAGINMVSGAGMLDFLACHSVEKLVLDADIIASAQRLLEGIQPRTPTLATGMFEETGHAGQFLKLPATRQWFRSEVHLPSSVIDREAAAEEGASSSDTFCRARQRARELEAAYVRSGLARTVEGALRSAVEPHAQRAGLATLPGL
jgi:trimethylamine--corrinoid protein Co-methyltransferase